MEKQIFRKQVMDRLSSPEELNDYLRVTNPGVWTVLIAVLLLIFGGFFWAGATYINSSASGTAVVENGKMRISFLDEEQAKNIVAGLPVKVGNSESLVYTVGSDENGHVFAIADTTLSDGTYAAEITYKTTQLIRLLFN